MFSLNSLDVSFSSTGFCYTGWTIHKVEQKLKNSMSWGVLKSTCRIDTLRLLKSTPGLPKSDPGLPKSIPQLPKSRPGATQNGRKFGKIDKVWLQGYLGRASVAPVVDFGRHLGALGIHGCAFWIVFRGPRAILDVSFSVFLMKLFLNHFFVVFF